MAKKKKESKKVKSTATKSSGSYGTMKAEGSKMSTKVGNTFKKSMKMGGKVC